jgi:organic hydroperoxide reductase OsmC/OhrA
MGQGQHEYHVDIEWTGNLGTGTSAYRAYSRDHVISAGGKPPIGGSSDPGFNGDADRWNPEDMLVASISTCHKLWYLSLCALSGVRVLKYTDHAVGHMVEVEATGGHFTGVELRPMVVIAEGDDLLKAERLHHEAHAKCFIANSVNFPVTCQATTTAAPLLAVTERA